MNLFIDVFIVNLINMFNYVQNLWFLIVGVSAMFIHLHNLFLILGVSLLICCYNFFYLFVVLHIFI